MKNSFTENQVFDCAIIGSGINGASIAACLSKQNLKVALFDKNDFANFTSQQSSNLVWGGIKYMENYEFPLVWNLCKSRNHLMKHYPNRIKEIRFLATRNLNDPHWLSTYQLGTWVYWLFGRGFTKKPKKYNCKTLKKLEPNIDISQSNGGIEYSDAYLIDNDARFVFQFVLDAIENGAIALNYHEVTSAVFSQNIWNVTFQNTLTQDKSSIQTKYLINCAGPFADHWNQSANIKTSHKHIFSKGVHLIVPRIQAHDKVLTFLSDDKRPFFVIPMGHRSCIGTTDTRITELPPKITDEDRNFILKNINQRLDLSQPITKDQIIGERCGVRPLVVSNKEESQDDDWINISRKHIVEEYTKNYCTVFGGKLTDCINIAEEVFEIIIKNRNNFNAPMKKWYGEPTDNHHKWLNSPAKECFDTKQLNRLWGLYGNRCFYLLENNLLSNDNLKQIFDDYPMILAEFEILKQTEHIKTFEDALRRRTMLDLIFTKKDLEKNTQIMKACKILFDEKWETQWKNYFGENEHELQ